MPTSPLSPPDRISSPRGVRPYPYLQRLDVYLESLQMPYQGQLPWPKKVRVWVVDGVYIRSNIDIEFDNYGQWWDFSYIPRNEAWVDRETQLDEWQFFLTRMEVERRLLRRHVAEAKVWPQARAAERRMRKDAGDFEELADGGRRDPAKVHIQLWKRLRSGLRVWIVRGRLVRSWFDLDFTAGGHDLVYRKYVPPREVWIDDDAAEGERPYILIHELRERALMAKGHRYHSAHDSANRFESACRRGLVDLEEALETVGWY
jgi:hypothetical protein